MAEGLIGLGSNLGDPEANLREAVLRLADAGRIIAVSSLYRTAPVGYADQDDFLNACLWMETTLSPRQLMEAGQAVERALARVRTVRNGPRTIDVDLLLWRTDTGAIVDHAGPPQLPHPRMGGRRFVLEPLAEIAGNWLHPIEGKTVAELFAALPEGEAVARFSSPTWPPLPRP